VNKPQNQIILKKLMTQFVAACAIFATGCGDEVAEDANDDEGGFEMGDEPTRGEELTSEGVIGTY
jgi:hypothetical protein